MSAYVDFFVRNGDDFIPLGDFSRNSIIYHTITNCTNVLPWEKIIPLTLEDLQAAQTHAHKHNTDALDYIDTLKDRIEEVKGFNNSVAEKLEQIEIYRGEIEECRQEAEEARYAENYFYFLADLIESAHDIDADKYIYAGIEIGRPTVEDIYEVPTQKGFVKSKCQKCGKEMLTPAMVFDPEAVRICPNCGAKMEVQE